MQLLYSVFLSHHAELRLQFNLQALQHSSQVDDLILVGLELGGADGDLLGQSVKLQDNRGKEMHAVSRVVTELRKNCTVDHLHTTQHSSLYNTVVECVVMQLETPTS